jgi:monoamine oxidase
MSRRDQVVIVGAGLTGLVTALELTEQGVDCVVLEAAPRPGGRVGTFTFPDGALAEAHLEEIWEGSPAFPLLSRLGLHWREHETPSSVLIDGVLHPYHRGAHAAYLDQLLGPEREAFLPFHERLSTLLGDLDAAHAEGRWTPGLERMMAVSLAAFVGGADLGPRATAWLRIVVEAETAIEWDRIAALDGVAELRPFLLDGDGRPRERNMSVVGGNERMIDALVSRLPEGTVRTGARVERVTDDGQGVTIRYRDGRGRQHAIAGHHAVVTTPVWTLPELGLDPGLLDAPSRDAVALTGAGTYVKVVLRLRERVGRLWDCHAGGAWTLLTDGDAGCVYALGDPADGRDQTDGRDEPDGRDEVVTMLIPSAPARALTGRPSQQIAARAIRSLDQLVARTPGGSAGRLCAGIAGAVTDVRVVDHPRAVAYWPQRCGRSRFDALAAALRAPHGRVLIGGDSTDSSHSDGAVRAAQRMAATILAGSPERARGLEPVGAAR